MARFEIIMPKMGESIIEATITKWLKSVGDKINEDDPIAEIATDKVDSEIPSPVEGVLKEILYKEGDVVPVGKIIAVIDIGGEAVETGRQEEEKTGRGEEEKTGGQEKGKTAGQEEGKRGRGEDGKTGGREDGKTENGEVPSVNISSGDKFYISTGEKHCGKGKNICPGTRRDTWNG